MPEEAARETAVPEEPGSAPPCPETRPRASPTKRANHASCSIRASTLSSRAHEWTSRSIGSSGFGLFDAGTGGGCHAEREELQLELIVGVAPMENPWGPQTQSRLRLSPRDLLRQCPTVLQSQLYFLLRRVLGLFQSNERASAEVELEVAVLRHQVAVLLRQVKRPVYRKSDRVFLAAVSRLLPREAWHSFMVRPETLLRWHRQLVKRKWTRPHRPPGRPGIEPESVLDARSGLKVGLEGYPA